MYLHDTKYCHVDLKKISSPDLYDVLEILTLYNKNMYCVTSIIFELSQREFQSIIESKTSFYLENTNLKRLKHYIKHLSRQGRFCKDKFRTLCHEIIVQDNITLDILWWLDQNNIFYFEEYWATKATSHIISQLKTLISSCEQNEYQQCIAQDIFLKLILCHNALTSILSIKGRNIFENYLEDALEELIHHPNDAKLIGFIGVVGEKDYLYGNLIKHICKNILRKLICCDETVTIFNAIQHQEKWSTKNFTPSTIELYFELLKRFTFDELFELIHEVSEEKLNWRLVLTLISVFVHQVPDSLKQLKSMIQRHLQSVFSDKSFSLLHSGSSDVVLILSGITIARQACLESPDSEKVYSEWFVNTFGSNCVLKTGSTIGAWALLLDALNEALPHDPQWVLRVHAARALRAPPMHNRDAAFYKESCRKRLSIIGNVNENTDSEDFCN